MIRLIDLPGVRDLENAMVLNNRARSEDHTFQARIDQVSIALFSVTEEDAGPPAPADDADDEAWLRYDDAYERFETTEITGWDLTDDHKRELLIAGRFLPQIRSVLAGFGKAPDIEAAGLANWEDRLAADARHFKRSQRKA